MLKLSCLALTLVALSPAALAAGPFDGTWSVTQDCPAAPDGARGYQFRFDVTVTDGNLLGHYGIEGRGASETLSGRIEPNGSAKLVAKGLNGKSEHTVGFQQPGSPFSFPVTARFEQKHGSGTRTTGRTCTFTFDRKS